MHPCDRAIEAVDRLGLGPDWAGDVRKLRRDLVEFCVDNVQNEEMWSLNRAAERGDDWAALARVFYVYKKTGGFERRYAESCLSAAVPAEGNGGDAGPAGPEPG